MTTLPRKTRPRRTAGRPAETKAEALDLQKLLLDGLAAEGVKPKIRKAPSGGYVSLPRRRPEHRLPRHADAQRHQDRSLR